MVVGQEGLNRGIDLNKKNLVVLNSLEHSGHVGDRLEGGGGAGGCALTTLEAVSRSFEIHGIGVGNGEGVGTLTKDACGLGGEGGINCVLGQHCKRTHSDCIRCISNS